MLPQEFIDLSAMIGKNYMFIQGAGGNSSYKINNEMWVKASGKWLSNAAKEDLFVSVDLNIIQQNIKSNNPDPLDGSYATSNNLRPSIETTLHALMQHKVVLHSHPIELLSLLILNDAEQQLNELLKDFNWAWIPYVRPGIELTNKVRDVVKDNKVDALLLGNHGLVVGAQDTSKAFNLMENILNCCKRTPRKSNLLFNDEINKLAIHLNMRLPKYEEIHLLAIDETSYNYCDNKKSVLYPDQAVFLGSKLSCSNNINNLKNDITTGYIIIKDYGVLISKDARGDIDEMLRCHAKILIRVNMMDKLNYLSEDEVGRLLDWEPEKYRQSIG